MQIVFRAGDSLGGEGEGSSITLDFSKGKGPNVKGERTRL